MPTELEYMNASGNIGPIFEKIRAAGAPPRFTHEFLKANLGFSSSNDRGVIKLLKALGFLDDAGTPTPRYHDFRDASKSGLAMAAGLRDGWADVFLSDERAFDKSATQLKSMFQSLTGKSESVAEKMASTFRALVALADFSSKPAVEIESPERQSEGAERPAGGGDIVDTSQGSRLLNLHSDVHIHLPPTTDVAVYTAIFRALREELLD